MEYNKLVAVSGLPGLYELINSKTDGAVVRSLDEKTTKFAASRRHQFSHLESIEIYTTGDNVNLVEVFMAMDAHDTELPDIKNDKAIRSYFEKVYAELDFDRVYTSDMKKMVKWFEILKKNNIDIKLSETENTEETEQPKAIEPEEGSAEETVENEKQAPAKKTAVKKSAKKKES